MFPILLQIENGKASIVASDSDIDIIVRNIDNNEPPFSDEEIAEYLGRPSNFIYSEVNMLEEVPDEIFNDIQSNGATVIPVKRISPNAVIPCKMTEGSAGYDLYADQEVIIPAMSASIVSTGLKMALPPNFEAQIRSRSGLAIKEKLFVLNSPGTIDSDYRGEICVILYNLNANSYHIKTGDRIAQMVIKYVTPSKIEEVDKLTETPRGDGGFGHTGI